jgi:hypothetical protein
LTPLSKGLIGLAVVGAMASAVWHLALKEHFNTPPNATTAQRGRCGESQRGHDAGRTRRKRSPTH